MRTRAHTPRPTVFLYISERPKPEKILLSSIEPPPIADVVDKCIVAGCIVPAIVRPDGEWSGHCYQVRSQRTDYMHGYSVYAACPIRSHVSVSADA